MKQVDEMPTSGQFVAVWAEDAELCADTFFYVGDNLYSLTASSAVDKGIFKQAEGELDLKYLIAD